MWLGNYKPLALALANAVPRWVPKYAESAIFRLDQITTPFRVLTARQESETELITLLEQKKHPVGFKMQIHKDFTCNSFFVL